MWERFRKAGGKVGQPAFDLQLGIRALQALFAVSFAFIALEWIRSRQLPYEFLLYGLFLELFLFLTLWSAFRLGRLGRQTMHRLALWVAAALSLPLSVYLTLVDAGGELRFVLLLIWFLAYGRNTGILLTVLYVSGVGALLLLSGQFQFFAGNDPIRSLIRATLLSVALLPLLIFIRARLLGRSVIPVRLTHLVLELRRFFMDFQPRSSAGRRLHLPDGARNLWSWLLDTERESLFRNHGPGAGRIQGTYLQLGFHELQHFIRPGLSDSAAADTIARRILEWQEYLDELALNQSVWSHCSATGIHLWATNENSPGILSILEDFLSRFNQDRNADSARGWQYPELFLELYKGDLWILSARGGSVQAVPATVRNHDPSSEREGQFHASADGDSSTESSDFAGFAHARGFWILQSQGSRTEAREFYSLETYLDTAKKIL